MRPRALVAAAALTLAVAGFTGSASAGLWSTVGGDIGRTGFQPADLGTAPYHVLWSSEDSGVATAPLVSSAQPQDGLNPRVIYATSDGRAHLRDLYTGDVIGDPAGTVLGKHANKDALTGFGGMVSPVEASTDGRLGQAYFVINDRFRPEEKNEDGVTDEIAIAQVDERSGRLVQYYLVPGTAKQTVSTSPVLTPPDGAGNRSLLFTATDAEKSYDVQETDPAGTLYRVAIAAADTDLAKFGETPETESVPTLNPYAPPVLLTSSDDSGAANGTLHLYATVSGRDAAAPIATFRSDTFCVDDVVVTCAGDERGPTAQKLEGDASASRYVFAMTPAVPLSAAGVPPGTAGSQTGRAAALVVASYDVKADESIVHRLVPSPDGTTFVEAARSETFKGRAAPQLAVTQLGQAGGDEAGKVILTTGRNLYALDGGDLSVGWKLDAGDGLRPGDTGFQTTSATVSGGVVFAVRDNGGRVAIDLASGKELDRGAFDPTTDATGTIRGLGSPAATSAGVIVFASDRGLVAYVNRCGHKLLGTSGKDVLAGTLAGDDVRTGSGDDEAAGEAGDDCLDGGGGNDTLDGSFGEDALRGADGNDRLQGGPGNDLLDGGEGNDVGNGGDGADTLLGQFGDDTLKGGPGTDTANGGFGDDRLYGASGNDKVDGGGGDDRLDGGSGNDTLRGGPGRDLLIGGNGNDLLSAGRGGGTVSAGKGNDRVNALNGQRDVIHCGAGRDTVTADRADRLDGCEVVRRGRYKKTK